MRLLLLSTRAQLRRRGPDGLLWGLLLIVSSGKIFGSISFLTFLGIKLAIKDGFNHGGERFCKSVGDIDRSSLISTPIITLLG